MKFEWQHLYYIQWLIWRQLTRKKSLLVTCKISRLFPNTLSADGKYSLFNRDNLTQPIQMQLSGKQKTFSRFFSSFLKFSLNFEHFQKKDDPHCWCISEITESCLYQYLKTPVSRNPPKSNMVNVPKHCWNLHGSTFTIFIDWCEGNWLRKTFFFWNAKS